MVALIPLSDKSFKHTTVSIFKFVYSELFDTNWKLRNFNHVVHVIILQKDIWTCPAITYLEWNVLLYTT